MAFSLSVRLLIKQLTKSEKLLCQVTNPRFPQLNVESKYIEKLKDMKIDQNDPASEFFLFPFKTFHKLSKKSLQVIINETYNLFKEKGLTTSEAVHELVNSCFYYGINFNVDELRKDLEINQTKPNGATYKLIIDYYCEHGKMDAVENLLAEMKSKRISLAYQDKFVIVAGYIIAGQPNKSEIFIKNNRLSNENFLLFNKCQGYAKIGDVDNLMEIFLKMKDKNIKFSAKNYFSLFHRLIEANIDKSRLDQIINMSKENLSNYKSHLYIVISKLNSVDNYKYSLYLLDKFDKNTFDNSEIIELFSTPACPRSIFEQVINLFINCEGKFFISENLFCGITFDTAIEITKKFSHHKRWLIIYLNLFNKAINEKSFPMFEKAIEFSVKNLQWNQFNMLVHRIPLKLMQENGMLSTYEDILDLFPKVKHDIFQMIMLKYLCSGDIDHYEKLRLQHENVTNVKMDVNINFYTEMLRSNVSAKDIKQWSTEARKYFNSEMINEILVTFITGDIIKLSKKGFLKEIQEYITYIKEWNVRFKQHNLDFLLRSVEDHAELIQSPIMKNINLVNAGNIQINEKL